MDDIKITLFHSFSEAQDVWREFEKHADFYGFQSYEWLSHWYQIVGIKLGVQPCLALVESRMQGPILFLPLGIKQTFGVRILLWLGGIITDYHAPLLGQEVTELSSSEFIHLWKEVKNCLPPFDLIYFEKQPQKIENHQNPFLFLECHHHDNSYSTYLVPDWKTFYRQRANSKTRATDRRKKRRLEDLGNVQFIIAREHDDIHAFTSHMIQQKIRRHRETGSRNMLAKESSSTFYLHMAQKLVSTGMIHLSALMADETIVASHWGMVTTNRFYWLMPAFEGGKWQKYSPGRLMLEELLQWCFKNDIQVFDFTIGGERYKNDWCNQEMKLYEYREAVSFKGYLYVLFINLKQQIKQSWLGGLIKRLRKWIFSG